MSDAIITIKYAIPALKKISDSLGEPSSTDPAILETLGACSWLIDLLVAEFERVRDDYYTGLDA